MTGSSQIQTHQSIQRHLAIALGLILLLVCGIGGLATTTELSGAVISSGQLVVDSEVKKVQHPHGGIVGQLLVSNGTRVKAGNVVIRLDETQTRANFEIVRKNLDELLAVDPADWTQELTETGKFFEKFGDRLPDEIRAEHKALADRLQRSSVVAK